MLNWLNITPVISADRVVLSEKIFGIGKYVTLVGSVLAVLVSRCCLVWLFVVRRVGAMLVVCRLVLFPEVN